MMKYSVGLPTCMEGMMFPVPFATPDQVVEVARRAEALGYDSVWGNDHMTTQQYVRGEFSEPPNFWDILITYAFVAAATTRLRVGTAMIVLPLRRDIVVLAKQIATLDQFSGGRLEIGVGIGAYREEFEALHPDWKVHRGDMVSEGIEALRTLFTERRASFEGKYYSFKDVDLRQRHPFVTVIGIGALVAGIWFYSEPVLLAMALGYAGSGVMTRVGGIFRRRFPRPVQPPGDLPAGA